MKQTRRSTNVANKHKGLEAPDIPIAVASGAFSEKAENRKGKMQQRSKFRKYEQIMYLVKLHRTVTPFGPSPA